ncbi:MAG: biotin/lipoyl-containing protein [Verrucomicrobiales bacterium]
MAAPAAAAVPAAAADGGAAPAPAPTGTFIESPMVGTFYRRSDPEAPALVDVGTKVDKNTTVCLIEAMKVFNEIKADATGTITKILVDDGSPVQFGEALFEIDPA